MLLRKAEGRLPAILASLTRRCMLFMILCIPVICIYFFVVVLDLSHVFDCRGTARG